MNLQTCIFIGRSGCGKGTQVEKMTEYLKSKDYRGVFHLEAGKHFREFIKKDTYSAKLAKEISENGGLQPEFLSVWAWGTEIVESLKFDEHLLLDGTPRRVHEAHVLESVFEFYNRQQIDVVYLKVSRNWAIERMQNRGRDDDKEMSDILNRMEWFENDVVPVIDYYKSHKNYIFHEINGEQSIEEIHSDIKKSLGI